MMGRRSEDDDRAMDMIALPWVRNGCLALLLLAPACFHPSYDHPTCGPSGECPSGLTCNVDRICEGAGGNDASIDGNDASGPGTPTCWTISSTNFPLSACTAAVVPRIDVTANVSIDTDSNVVPASGLGCAPLTSTSVPMCALAAGSITIAAGVTLSAHGNRPLALLGHAITINGTIDVASHIMGGQRGPASPAAGCNPGALANNSGGGAGGGYGTQGGRGGEEGGNTGPPTGGLQGNTVGAVPLRGGCDGGRGGDASTSGGPNRAGGAGGGAVWIALDTGTLVIGSPARINASGASGGRGIGSAVKEQGGDGGGSGGLIVLQAPAILLDATAQIFANGGHGGGGSEAGVSGHDGTDATGPTSGGSGGDSGTSATVGSGGAGYPASGASLNGANGDPAVNGGGGGGGGGAGEILVASSTTLTGANVSPPPVRLTP
jgi:hypothetical protein